MAFGCLGIFNFGAKELDCLEIHGYQNGSEESVKCIEDLNFEPTIKNTMIFSVVSSLFQLVFDQFSSLMVTCACVQNSSKWIKSCAEGLGKIVFWIFAVGALVFLINGAIFVARMKQDAGVAFAQFVIIRLINFMVLTSAITFVTFLLARRGQMKPAADVLATEAGKKKWEEPAGLPCTKKTAPCELWNKFHGEDKHFEDLPGKPFDYDYELKIALFIFFCSKPCCKVKAKNPMPEGASKDPEAPPPTAVPAQLAMGGEGGGAEGGGGARASMMQVVVPPGQMGGQSMQVQTSMGVMQVTIPEGVQAGQTFQFQLPDEAAGAPATQLPATYSAQTLYY